MTTDLSRASTEIIATKRPETQRAYRAAWAGWLAHLGDRAPATATRADVLAWVRALRSQGLGVGTVATRLAACSAIWRGLVARGVVEPATRDLFSRVDCCLYAASQPAPPLPAQAAARLLRAVPRRTVQGARDYALLGLLLATGARPAAVLALRVGDVQPAAVVLAGQIVPLPAGLYGAVQDYLARTGRTAAAADAYLFAPLRTDAAACFGRDLPAARALSAQQLRNIVQRRLAAAGLHGAYTIVSLRRSHGVQL